MQAYGNEKDSAVITGAVKTEDPGSENLFNSMEVIMTGLKDGGKNVA